MASDELCRSIFSKVEEQIERTVHLIALVPAGDLDWQPPIPGAWSVGRLLGHLLDAIAGFCAVLAAIEPTRLAHFAELRNAAVNHSCSPSEAISRIAKYRDRIEEGFGVLSDEKLRETVPTVFVECGEPVMTLLLGNLEHLVNHKHQLFTYLKYMGVAVNTRDLYHFRRA